VNKRLYTTREAAAYLNLAVTTLEIARLKGTLSARPLPFIKMGKSVRYDISDLDAFIEARRIKSTSETPRAAA